MKNMMKYTKVSGIKTNKQGQGTLLQIDSNNNRKIMYEGQWLKDKKHGQGKGIWNNGKGTFEGQWERDYVNGL